MHLALLFGVFLGAYLIYMIFVGGASSLCAFASNHPYRFTRGRLRKRKIKHAKPVAAAVAA